MRLSVAIKNEREPHEYPRSSAIGLTGNGGQGRLAPLVYVFAGALEGHPDRPGWARYGRGISVHLHRIGTRFPHCSGRNGEFGPMARNEPGKYGTTLYRGDARMLPDVSGGSAHHHLFGDPNARVGAAMRLNVEKLTAGLIEELRPLWQACWDECSEIKGKTCAFHGERGFVIEPDIERYATLADQGTLFVVTLRNDELRGYAICLLYRSLHHHPVLCGNVDTFYVEKDCRSYAASVIGKIEEEFSTRGVSVMGWPTSPDGALFKVLQTLGYIPDDVVMEKRLCA